MKKSFALALTITFLFISNSFAQLKLSNEEAMKIIKQVNEYPRMVSLSFIINVTPSFNSELQHLFSTNILKPSSVPHEAKYLWYATEKGKSETAVRKLSVAGQQAYYFEFVAYNQDVDKITDILTDSTTGTAIVKYENKFKYSDYFYKVLKSAEQNKLCTQGFGCHPDESYLKNRYGTGEIKLKKWDQGWRIAK